MKILKFDRPQIMLTGYYGQRNTGDDALAATIAWGLYRFLSPRRLLIGSSQLVMPEGILVHFLPRRLFKGHLKLVQALWLIGSDFWCFGGGSVFHDVLGPSLLRKLRDRIRNYKRLRRGKVIALGVSLGPVERTISRTLLGDILELLDLVAVRDPASLELAASLGATKRCVLGFDAAVLLPRIGLPGITPPGQEDEDVIVSVAPCNFHGVVSDGLEYLDTRRNEALAAALSILAQDTGVRFKILEFNGHRKIGDAPIVYALARSLPSHRVTIVPYSPNPLEALEHIRRSSCVIAIRLHAAIFAFTAGVPFVAISYHPKVREFARYVGLPEQFVVDGDRTEPKQILAAVRSILDSPSAASSSMPLDVAQRRALNMFAEAAKLWPPKMPRQRCPP